MIHPCNALLAGGAVMTHWDLYLVALLAHPLEDGFDMHYLLYTEVIVVFYWGNDLIFWLFSIFVCGHLNVIWNILHFSVIETFYLLKNSLILVEIKLQSIKPNLSIITYYLSFLFFLIAFNTWFQYTINASLHSRTYISLLHSLLSTFQGFLWFIIAIIFTAWSIFSSRTKLS